MELEAPGGAQKPANGAKTQPTAWFWVPDGWRNVKRSAATQYQRRPRIRVSGRTLCDDHYTIEFAGSLLTELRSRYCKERFIFVEMRVDGSFGPRAGRESPHEIVSFSFAFKMKLPWR
jgi:hypothetical protein